MIHSVASLFWPTTIQDFLQVTFSMSLQRLRVSDIPSITMIIEVVLAVPTVDHAQVSIMLNNHLMLKIHVVNMLIVNLFTCIMLESLSIYNWCEFLRMRVMHHLHLGVSFPFPIVMKTDARLRSHSGGDFVSVVTVWVVSYLLLIVLLLRVFCLDLIYGDRLVARIIIRIFSLRSIDYQMNLFFMACWTSIPRGIVTLVVAGRRVSWVRMVLVVLIC